MALADIPQDNRPGRLDSWKEIAKYLRRDVRTATRWESQGLPLHRVAGAKGRSVFAFTHEIDDWMAGRPGEPATDGSTPVPAQTTPAVEAPSRVRTLVITAACGAAGLALGLAAMSIGWPSMAGRISFDVTATTSHVALSDASGSRVLHQFNPGAILPEAGAVRVEDLDADGAPEVLATVVYYQAPGGRSTGSGEILNLSTSGGVRWKFGFDDTMAFAGGRVSPPWVLTDWQAEPGTRLKRVAIAAHEATWWASLVTVFDHTRRRLGSFVNPGWIESVEWRSKDQLAVAGFNNLRDEAMFAVLDANHLEGQAPGSAGTVFACTTCSSATPLFYATFARSEVNQAAAARFNRGNLSMSGDRLIVTTVEFTRQDGDATALYEFDRDLRFVRARYSDTYWSEHRRLELEGRLNHAPDACPEREGPAVHVWDQTRGWTRVIATGGS